VLSFSLASSLAFYPGSVLAMPVPSRVLAVLGFLTTAECCVNCSASATPDVSASASPTPSVTGSASATRSAVPSSTPSLSSTSTGMPSGLQIVAGVAGSCSYSGEVFGSAATSTHLNSPSGVAWDAATGTIYVALPFASCVAEVRSQAMSGVACSVWDVRAHRHGHVHPGRQCACVLLAGASPSCRSTPLMASSRRLPATATALRRTRRASVASVAPRRRRCSTCRAASVWTTRRAS
jgi:hypothetical protein